MGVTRGGGRGLAPVTVGGEGRVVRGLAGLEQKGIRVGVSWSEIHVTHTHTHTRGVGFYRSDRVALAPFFVRSDEVAAVAGVDGCLPWETRSNLCMLGSFRHRPNVDSVKFVRDHGTASPGGQGWR